MPGAIGLLRFDEVIRPASVPILRPDERQPAISRWHITPPPANSTAAFVVQFDEPLDHAMLEHVIALRSSDGSVIAGTIAITNHEQRWAFTPNTPWRAGSYILAVESILEDNAGNSLGRPFEVNLNQPLATTPPELLQVPFDIK